MASLSHTYTDTRSDDLIAAPRTRFGRRRPAATTKYERNERYTGGGRGSHAPIDTSIHWEWRNPLNILPALILFFLAVAVVAMVLA
jgi:hypothetical protein